LSSTLIWSSLHDFSFYHVIGLGEETWRYRQAELTCRAPVDGEVEPGRRLDRFRPDDSFGADYDRSRRPDRTAGDAALPSLPDARSIQAAGGMVAWIELKAYPAILAFYAAGLGAMSANRHRLIKRLFAQTLPHNGISAVRSLLPLIALPETLRVNIWTAVYSANNRVTPVSEHLFNLMKEDLREFAGSIEDFEWLFDQFEILCALSYVDASIAFDEDPSAAERWFPVGRFSRHKSYYDERIKGVDNWVTQAATERDNWPPIAAGMFSGDYNRFSKLLAAFKNWFAKIPVY